jgi:hypothetical protein
MGYDTRQLTITARVSRHNSEQDVIDDLAWERLRLEIEDELHAHPERYEPINVQITVP